jgi:hypothetical protein
MNFGKMEEEYFCVEDWTGGDRLKLLKKIEVSAQRGTFVSRELWNNIPDARKN